MSKKIAMILCVSLVTFAAACDSKNSSSEKGDKEKATAESNEEGSADEKKEGGEKAEKKEKKEAKAGPQPIGEMGITGVVPEGAKIKDAMVGDGKSIQGPGIVVGVKAADKKHKLADAVSEAKDMYSGKKITKKELENGWNLTFVNEGGAGKNYWVKAYREFGDKKFLCETTASQKAQQDKALKFCNSLAKK